MSDTLIDEAELAERLLDELVSRGSVDLQDFKFDEDDKVKWDGGNAMGLVRDRTAEDCYDASIDGDVKVCGEPDDPAYLIQIFDDEEGELEDTMVAHKESTLSSADFELSQKTLSDVVSSDLTGFELSQAVLDAEVVFDEDEDDLDSVYSEWDDHVNMTASELERWSGNPCSREASKDPEAVIKRNLRLLERNKDEWTENDIEDAKRTISFISRMRANKPDEPRDGPHGCPSEWAISLLNWAFNPFDDLPDKPEDDDLDDVDKVSLSQEETVVVNPSSVQKGGEVVFDGGVAQGEKDSGSGSDSVRVAPSGLQSAFGSSAELAFDPGSESDGRDDEWFQGNWLNFFEDGSGSFSFQTHWFGLGEEQTGLSSEELMELPNPRLSSVLRLSFDGTDATGINLFEERDEIPEGFESSFSFLSSEKDASRTMQGVWMDKHSSDWMKEGFDSPSVYEPGSKGATDDMFAKLFGVDSGTVEVGMAHKHAVELFFDGDVVDGRVMASVVPVLDGRIWVLRFTSNQEPIASRQSLEDKVAQLRNSRVSHSHLIWNNPDSEEDLRRVNVNEFDVSEGTDSEEDAKITMNVASFDELMDELWS